MFPAKVLRIRPGAGHDPVVETRDWGVSHDVEEGVGRVDCVARGGERWERRQALVIQERFVGHLVVSFDHVSLPEDSGTGAEIEFFSYDPDTGAERYVSEYRRPDGFEYDARTDGVLFSPLVPGEAMIVVAHEFAWGACPPRVDPYFSIRAWRHLGGDLPERIVLRALQYSYHTDNWFDFYQMVMAADRNLSAVATQHQGSFFMAAFENHGIDRYLGDFCRQMSTVGILSGPYRCHGVWWGR
jgi:hypothetical protein